MRRLGVWVLALGLWSARANAATYYVAQTGGSDGRSCATAQTLATPRATITGGMACALAAGAIVEVRTGTYVENLIGLPTAGTSGGHITIRKYANEVVTLAPSGGNHAIYWASEDYIDWDGINIDSRSVLDAGIKMQFGAGVTFNTLKNFTMTHRGGLGQTNAAILIEGTDNTVFNVDISGTGGPYGIYVTGDRNTIENNNVHGVSYGGIHVYHNSGNPTSNIIRNNRIHDIAVSSWFNAADTRFFGILVYGTTNTVYNNVIYNNSVPYNALSPGNACIQLYNATGTTIYNNTCTGNTSEGIWINSGSTSTTVRNNLFYNNTQADIQDDNAGSSTKSNNTISGNALFANAGSGDYRLLLGSPAIDTGFTVGAVTTDFNGVVRPQGSAYDIGAYEFISGGSFDPSPSGTRITTTSQSITDAGGNIWTLIVNGACAGGYSEIRQNGNAVATLSCGSQILFYLNVVYVRGDDDAWYQWNGTGYVYIGADPNPGSVQSVTVGLRTRWFLR